jgi:uncharacterized protein YecE (DUF72 family)
MAKRGTLYIGTSNIVLPVARKDFPEGYREMSRLRYYSSLFNSLEVNSSFYKVPKRDTFAKWANDVPDDFRFTVKLWREITHRRKLTYDPDDISLFMQAADGTGAKKGCLLVQFPASITEEYHESVHTILSIIQQHNHAPAWKVCVELRHTSWYNTDSTLQMLNECDASLTGHDMPKSKTLPWTSRRTLNIRFHGEAGDYRGSYTPDALDDYAHRIDEWIGKGNDVYVYFNNTLGEAFNNARYLQEAVKILQKDKRSTYPPQTIHH